MAKLLIIDDQVTMVDLIRKQFQELNAHFGNGNVFYFDDMHGNLSIQSWQLDQDHTRRRIQFDNNFPALWESICSFLSQYPNERILILIDVLLKSDNTNAPSIERYIEDQEFSCELYAELLKMKNGKITFGYNIDPNKFFFMLYSRSGASNSVVSSVLHTLYNQEEAQFFPCECCKPENISWCKNQCEITDDENIVDRCQRNAEKPLVLPDEFEEFIEEL